MDKNKELKENRKTFDFDLLKEFHKTMKKDFSSNLIFIESSGLEKSEILEYKNSSQQIFIDLFNPIQTCTWILHPTKFLAYLKREGDNESIIYALRELSELAEDHEDLYSFEFEKSDISYEIFPFMSQYNEIRIKLLKDVNRKLMNNVDDISKITGKLVTELFNLVDNEIEETILNSDQLKNWYRIALIEFVPVLLYQTQLTEDKILSIAEILNV